MRAIEVEDINLGIGTHDNPSEGLCLLEAVAYVAGEAHSDHPQCVSPVLGAYGRKLNDCLGNEDRQKLKPFIVHMPGTADDGLDEVRGYIATDWVVRTATPRLLRAANHTALAERLEALALVKDKNTASAAEGEALRVREIRSNVREAAFANLEAHFREEIRKRRLTGTAPAPDVAALVGDLHDLATIDAVVDAAVDCAVNAANVAAFDAANDAVVHAAVDAAVDGVVTVVVDAAAAAAHDSDEPSSGKDYWVFRNLMYEQVRDALLSSESALGAAVRLNAEESIALLGRMIAAE